MNARTILSTITLAAPALAQAPVYDISGSAGDEFGRSVAWVGDIDLDGRDDFAVGAPFGNGLEPDAGYVNVHSGRTNAAILTVLGERTGDLFGFSVAGLGDINFDGVPDLIVGAPFHDSTSFTDRGAAYTFSGATGQQIFKHGSSYSAGTWYGWSVAGVGDVNADGVPDYAIGLPSYSLAGVTDRGCVVVFSGATPTPLRSYLGTDPGDMLGYSVAGVGDVTGDGVPDLVAGAPYYDTGYALPAGRAYLLDGTASGVITHLATGSSTGGQLGHAVTGGADFDADGVPDIAVGEPFYKTSGIPRGRVRVLSGATLAVIQTLVGTGDDQFGYSVGALADADGDGHGDLMVGLPRGDIGGNVDFGLVQVFSGASWQLRYQWNGYHLNERMGHAVASGGLVNADPWTDMLSGSNGFDNNGTDCGRARLVLGNAEVATVYCTAKTNSAGCVPLISYAGCSSVSISNGFHLLGLNVLQGPVGMLIWSQAAQAVPFYGGTLCVAAPIRRTPVQMSFAYPGYPCTGAYDFHFSHAYMASVGLSAGTDVCTQFWSRDPGFAPPQNVGLTNALKFTVLP